MTQDQTAGFDGCRESTSRASVDMRASPQAVFEHRAPAGAAIDGALGFLGAALLAVPGFVTDTLGALLIARPTRALTRRWLSRRYAGRMMSFVATAGRFASSYRGAPSADVESTAVEDDDAGQLGR